MTTIDHYLGVLRGRLAETKLTDRQLAEAAQGAFTSRWLTGFRTGAMSNPQIQTLRALERALDSRGQAA